MYAYANQKVQINQLFEISVSALVRTTPEDAVNIGISFVIRYIVYIKYIIYLCSGNKIIRRYGNDN